MSRVNPAIYTVEDIAKVLKIEPVTVRYRLRSKGILKNKDTGMYGWNDWGEFTKVCIFLSENLDSNVKFIEMTKRLKSIYIKPTPP